MIRLIFGNVGSGKTSSAVLYMKQNPHKFFITNIDIRGKEFSHVVKLKGEMIIKKEIKGTKRDGTETRKLSMNVDFWKNLVKEKGDINIVLDEAHVLLNPRRSMSKINIIMGDWISMLRRVIGDGNNELILITQLSRRLDIVAKEMSSDVQFCIHHYLTQCSNCKATWWEHNEMANKFLKCPRCKDWRLKKIRSYIEVFCFKNVDAFVMYKESGMKTYYSRYMIRNIESIWKNYNTLQWEDMLSEFY
jgi:DNA-directed RNA polymerase subunit RPC12/RpoP